MRSVTLGGTDKIQGNGGSILLIDLLRFFVTFNGIVEHEENTNVYVGIIEHTVARMIKIVEMVSGHCHNSKNTNLCNQLAYWS